MNSMKYEKIYFKEAIEWKTSDCKQPQNEDS